MSNEYFGVTTISLLVCIRNQTRMENANESEEEAQRRRVQEEEDSSSRAATRWVAATAVEIELEVLECPVCYRPLKPPVFQVLLPSSLFVSFENRQLHCRCFVETRNTDKHVPFARSVSIIIRPVDIRSVQLGMRYARVAAPSSPAETATRAAAPPASAAASRWSTSWSPSGSRAPTPGAGAPPRRRTTARKSTRRHARTPRARATPTPAPALPFHSAQLSKVETGAVEPETWSS